jgi:protein SCO1
VVSARPRIARVGAILALAPILTATATGCSAGSARDSATQSAGAPTPAASGFDGAALPSGVPAPRFSLRDQGGTPVSLAAYRGHVVLVAFLYSTCGSSCVVIAQQIRGALDELGTGIPVLVISADPAADTPARVRRFLAQVSLRGRARWLSGSRAQMQRVWHVFRVLPASAGHTAFARSASVFLIDRSGRERVIFQLEQLTPEALAHDIRKLLG